MHERETDDRTRAVSMQESKKSTHESMSEEKKRSEERRTNVEERVNEFRQLEKNSNINNEFRAY